MAGERRAGVVGHVLDGREPERRERRVDDAIDHPVELTTQEVEDAEDPQPLPALFHDRRDHADGEPGRHVLVEEEREEPLERRVDGRREPAGGDRAPPESQRETPPGFRVVAVEDSAGSTR